MSVRIYLAGRVGVAVESELLLSERVFRDRQSRRAFAFLALAQGRPVSRDELAAIVWPQDVPDAWDSALSALVSRLRGLLAKTALRERGLSIRSGFGQFQLVAPSDTWIDLEAAAGAIDDAEIAIRAGAVRQAFGPAGVVYAIARRPFLAGDNGAWVEAQRSTLERQLVRALECLTKVWLASGEPIHAVESASEAIAIDRYRESSYQLLMQAQSATGNRAKAIQTYHELRQLLVDDLGVDPTPETAALYLELLRREG
jgi:DNA-binding SARP family transcriptional activator